MSGIVFGMDLHPVEHTVVLVLGAGGKHHLPVAGDLQVNIVAAVVGEGDAPDFRRALLEHRDLRLGLNPLIHPQETDLVAGEADMIALRQQVERGVGVAPQPVVLQVAYEQV